VDNVEGRQPPRLSSHTNTGEWQSFEVRMRRRRVERLIVRAETALADGNTDEVREALEEARRLAPGVPQIAALEQALETAPVDLPLVTIEPEAIDVELVPEVLAEPAAARHPGRRIALAAAAVLAMAVGAGAAWVYTNGTFYSGSSVSEDSSQAVPAANTTPAPPSQSVPMSAASTRVHVETVNASTFGLRSEPKALEPIAQLPPVQLASAESSTPVPAPTSGAGVPAPPARDLEPVPATFAERTAPLPALDVPPSNTIAEARTTIPLSAPEIKPAPKPEPAAFRSDASSLASEDAAVRGVLNRYATAYSHLDAVAAQEVWPAVNRSALSRAFDGLASQRVSLERCAIDVKGITAHATCAGSATWSPKIGNGGSRTEARNWTFQLAKAGEDWQIVSARVQNQNR
jgi:hypothetical protein